MDLKPLDFKTVLKETHASTLTVTNAKHISPVRSEGEFTKFKFNSETSLNNNSVDVETEALKSAKTKDEHAEAAGIYRKYNDMLRRAIGGGGFQ